MDKATLIMVVTTGIVACVGKQMEGEIVMLFYQLTFNIVNCLVGFIYCKIPVDYDKLYVI